MNEQDPQFEIVAKASLPQFIRVGKPPRERLIAYRSRAAATEHPAFKWNHLKADEMLEIQRYRASDNSKTAHTFGSDALAAKPRPGIVWLGGFKSDMSSLKATAIDTWAEETGRAYTRFDYSGHGASQGQFEDATLSDWLEESLAVLRAETEGPQVLVGSSMGGWIALLIARALQHMGEEKRLAALVLIAPAVDFTERLIWARLSPEARADLETKGFWLRPSAYAAEPYPITLKLIEDGRKHLLFGSLMRTYCPVHILQGLKDEDVPPAHAQTLVEHLVGDEVVLTSIKDGDHRLSRPEDFARLIAAIEAIA